MAKGKQYYTEYTNENGRNVKLEIWVEGFDHGVDYANSIPISLFAGSLILEYGEKAPIRSPILTFDLKTTTFRQFEHLFNTPPMNVSVRLYIDEEKIFDGYAENEVYDEQKANVAIWSTRITAHTGVKWLKDVKTFDEKVFDRFFPYSPETLFDILQRFVWMSMRTRMEFTSIKVRASVQDKLLSLVHTTTNYTFLRAFLRGISFRESNGDSISVYDFVEGLMSQFDCELYKYGDSIHIVKEAEKFNPLGGTYREITYTNAVNDGVRSDINYPTPYVFNDSLYVVGGASMTKSNGVKIIEIEEDLERIDNLVSENASPLEDEASFRTVDYNFMSDINKYGPYQWVSSNNFNGGEFDAEFVDGVFHLADLNKWDNWEFDYDQGKVNDGVYTKGMFYLNSNVQNRSLTISFDIKANTTSKDLLAGCWLIIKPRSGNPNWDKWRNVYVSQYSANNGKTCIKELNMSTPANYYPRPVPTAKAINYPKDSAGNNDLVENDGYISVSFNFNLTDLNDVLTYGLNTDGVTANIPSCIVDFCVGFLPMMKDRDALSDNLLGGASYAEEECWIRNPEVKISQKSSPTDLYPERGNVSEYTINTDYFERQSYKVSYPCNLSINHLKALMSDSGYTPISLWEDPSFLDVGVPIFAPLEDWNAMWRMQLLNKPRTEMNLVVKSKSNILKPNDMFSPQFMSEVFYINSMKWVIDNDSYKLKLTEYIKDDGITLP